MVGHLPNPNLLVEVAALEAQQVDRLRRKIQPHPVQDLVPFRLRGKEFGRLDIPAEDRIGKGGRRLLRPMDDDLHLPLPNLPHDLPHSIEVRM